MDRKMIEIFNSYKKNKIIIKQRKIKDLFKKRLGKKKFFKIKREDDKNNSLEWDKERNNLKEIPLNCSIGPCKNENSNIPCTGNNDCGRQEYIHKNLEEISIMNKNFFSIFLSSNYDYDKTMKLFKSYSESNSVYQKFFGNVTSNLKKF